ncbi:MAG TPA: glycerate kinase [Armatimonadota bacterium]|nr:glycerate kinase [Armatimonadota bacterium]
MKIIICPDSFKGSLSASDAAAAIDAGVASAFSDAKRELIPLADGGEGTVDALTSVSGGQIINLEVAGPLGEPVQAYYGVMGDGKTAVIEMAAASGLDLVPSAKRDPRFTTTYGTGQLILDAYNRGYRSLIIGIGGSATNDAGTGALSALGVRFLDAHGQVLPPGGAALAHLSKIDTSAMKIDPSILNIRVACDVTNPLVGPEGASVVYGPQKGASSEIARELDDALKNFASIVERDLGITIANTPGAGAAGGLGAGLMAFLDAHLESGIDIVLDVTRFDDRINDAHLILTGEGRVDRQTAFGKVISGVLKRAKRAGVPVVVIAGGVGEGSELLYPLGATGIFSIAPGPITLEESINSTRELLSRTAENIVRVYAAGRASKST